MKFWKSILLAAVLAAPLLASCKKDDDETKDYLDGSLSIGISYYMLPGDSKTFCLDTLMTLYKEATGNPVGYYYTDAYNSICDTLVLNDGTVLGNKFTITAPDSLGTFAFSLVAMGDDDYYSTTASGSYTVVRQGLNGRSSLTNYSLASEENYMTDPRDGRKYLVSEIGGMTWMRQNLAWEGSGYPFRGCKAVSPIFGRYYTFEEAQKACPEGWRLPNDSDWIALASACGVTASPLNDIKGLSGSLMEDIYFNGEKMWEYWPDVKMNNKAGLSIMPCGYATLTDGSYDFDGFESYAALWTADPYEDSGLFRYIYVDKSTLFLGSGSQQDLALNVRCVKK